MSQVPRHDVPAECAVIEALMLTTEYHTPVDSWALVQGIVAESDFYSPGAAAAFSAIAGLHDRGTIVEPVAVWSELGARNKRIHWADIRAFGEAYVGTDASIANVVAHAETVAACALQRRVVAFAQKIAADGYGDVGDVTNWASKVAASFDELASAGNLRGDFETYADVLRKVDRERTEMRQSGRQPMRLPSGMRSFDANVALRPGALVVVSASAGMGKTAFASTVALHVASQWAWQPEERMAFPGEVPAVLYIAMEMTDEEMSDRLLCNQASVHKGRYDRGRMMDDENTRVAKAANDAPAMPLYLMDETDVTIGDIIRNVRKCAKDAEEMSWSDGRRGRLRLVVIDYLGLMDIEERKGETLSKAIGNVVKRLKKLARREGICIMLACQINRAHALRKDPRPMLADLRDSGEIEQHADAVVFLYREAAASEQSTMGDIAEANVGKQRNGKSPARCYLHWEGPSTKFTDPTSDEMVKILSLGNAS